MLNQLISKLGILAFVFLATAASAKQVPLDQAEDFAKVAFAMKSTYNFSSIKDLEIKDHYTKTTYNDAPAYYIFNMAPKGFVIIAADDRYNPVLAFSDESNFDINRTQANESLFATLGDHERKIHYIRQEGILPPENINKEWSTLKEAKVENFLTKDPDGMVVAPLTTTKWNQGQYYNAYTPKDSKPDAIDGGTYCGCAPLAMSQLVKFHNYPPSGNGTISYDDPDYGTQAVDFCNTTYDWAGMPDELTDYDDDVAEFIYHIGAATRTEYSTTYTSTFVSYVRDALVNIFKFDESARWFYDSENEFAEVAVDDLNKGRPLILTGDATTGGAHAWVADGYGYFLDPQPNQADIYFHFNWGWGGDNNGWFLDTGGSWAPIPDYDQPGTYYITYYYNRYVVHNVFPSQEECPAPGNVYTSGIGTNGVYLHYSESSIDFDETIVFRYRAKGDNTWKEVPPTTAFYTRVNGLERGTEYEFQVKRECCTNIWSAYSPTVEFKTEGTPTGGGGGTDACANFINSNLTTSSITENFAYIYTSTPYGNVANQFRYRFVGSAIWTYSDIVTNYYRSLSNLEAGTEYEFQVRHTCAAGQWTDFTASQRFMTKGSSGCEMKEVDLFTSSITTNSVYIYTTQPYGRVTNQFRYRPIGTTSWTTSSSADNYYRLLSGLMPGTEYEFQVQHLCDANTWADWSFSNTFTTQGGGGASNCDAINGQRLYTSSITKANAYVYTPQPFGNVANQFRYRPVGSPGWLNSAVSTLYYRYLRDLAPDTEYEFQVSHECAVGQWTEWSASQTFRSKQGLYTPGSGKILPPFESPDFDESMLIQAETTIYPNPAVDLVFFKLNKAFGANSRLSIINMNGEEIQNIDLSEGQYQQEVPVSQLVTGVYMLRYTSDYEQLVDRFYKN